MKKSQLKKLIKENLQDTRSIIFLDLKNILDNAISKAEQLGKKVEQERQVNWQPITDEIENKIQQIFNAYMTGDRNNNEQQDIIFKENLLKENLRSKMFGNQKLTFNNDVINKMEGLSNIQDLKILKTKLRALTTEWLNEGFEKQDIKKYLSYLIEEI